MQSIFCELLKISFFCYFSVQYRATTRTPLNSFSKVATNAKTSGKNVWKIMDFSVARPYKVCRDAKHGYYQEEALSGMHNIKMARANILDSNLHLSFLNQQIQRQNTKTNYRIRTRQLCKATEFPKVNQRTVFDLLN